MPSDPITLEIPGYALSRLLGKGGMGSVYLATQRSLNREVAVKVLSSALVSKDPASKERFLREARIAANLHHPHVGAVHDVVELEGTAFIAMEFLPGGSVAKGSSPPADAREVLRVVREVASALDYAHANGVVHRDIKPENILRRRDGSCVVADFGIARAIEAASTITGEGAIVGTPHYMSPEQLRGEKIDGRADLYALGVTMYQMLTGALPYVGSDTWAIGIMHMTAPIPRLPPEHARLQPLLDSLMAKSPEDRPQSGAELVAKVDALLAPPRTTPAQALKKPVKPLHAIALGALVLGLVALLSTHAPWRRMRGAGDIAALTSASSTLPRIAVLPLESPGVDAAHADFADSLHEELLTALTNLSGVQVISRTTMKVYRGSDKPPKAIAAELHATHVLSGTVRIAGEELLLNLELLDVGADAAVWSHAFPRKLTGGLHLQGEVADEVARVLKARVLPAGRAALAERETDDAMARELYLKARLAMQPAVAEPLLDVALERDPDYIAARAERARVHLMRYWNFDDLTPERLARARSDLEVLEKIAPDSAHTEFARACYDYYARLDYDGAIARAEKLAESFPNRPDLQFLLAALDRARGKFDESTRRFELGLELDPLNVGQRVQFVSHLAGLRQYKRALAEVDRLLAIAPDERQFQRLHAEIVYSATGDASEFRALLAKHRARMQEQERRDIEWLLADIAGDIPAVVKELETPLAPVPGMMRVVQPQAARTQNAAWLEGDVATAQINLDEALAFFAKGPDRYPDRSLPKVQAATSYAFAGDRANAVRLIDEVLALNSIGDKHARSTADAVEDAGMLVPAAMPLAIVGERARAIDLIERSLSLPFGAAWPSVFDAEVFRRTLGDEPRYRALEAKWREQARTALK